MSDVTGFLSRLEAGDEHAAKELLPLVYDELRKLASAKLSEEKPGQTLQATALVHEAYIRLVGTENTSWKGRGHFFGAAAEAMRRILIENARRKGRVRHGGELCRVHLDRIDLATVAEPDQLLAVNEAIEALESEDQTASDLVKLRYFAGLSMEQAAAAMGIAKATAYRHWTFARAFLQSELTRGQR